MPKGHSLKTDPAYSTIYVFHTCPCGWECLINNVKDIKRAEKLRGIRVRCHGKKCEVSRSAELTTHTGNQPIMNGSNLTGRDAKNVDLFKHMGGDVRRLMKHQFPEVETST